MAKVLDLVCAKCTFLPLCKELVLSQCLKYSPKVVIVLLYILAKDQYVIKIDNHEFPQHVTEGV